MVANKHNRDTGLAGEEATAAYLVSLGWTLLRRRYRSRFGEIDIVAQEPTPDGTATVFVEVKSRRNRAHGLPIEAVGAVKRTRLIETARLFIAEQAAGGDEPAFRFDVAEVYPGKEGRLSVTLRRGVILIE